MQSIKIWAPALHAGTLITHNCFHQSTKEHAIEWSALPWLLPHPPPLPTLEKYPLPTLLQLTIYAQKTCTREYTPIWNSPFKMLTLEREREGGGSERIHNTGRWLEQLEASVCWLKKGVVASDNTVKSCLELSNANTTQQYQNLIQINRVGLSLIKLQ